VLDGKPVLLKTVVRVAADGARCCDHQEVKEKAPAGQSGKQDKPDSLQPVAEAVPTEAGPASALNRPSVANKTPRPYHSRKRENRRKPRLARVRHHSPNHNRRPRPSPRSIPTPSLVKMRPPHRASACAKNSGTGIHLTDNAEQAGQEFGGDARSVIQVYVSIKNPYDSSEDLDIATT
jgi:hypothetical protein